MDEIVNRVAQSSLITVDLEELYPKGERKVLDIAQFLLDGFVLKEKDFREALKTHDWESYLNAFVALHCSTDAILPAWAFLLPTTYLSPSAKKVVQGDLQELEKQIFMEVVDNLPLEPYIDGRIIVKGCSKLPIPAEAYVALTHKLTKVAKSLMYGEACSSVPLFKRKD